MIREAFEVRRQSDYDAYVQLTKEDVVNKYHEMKEFIATIENFLRTG